VLQYFFPDPRRYRKIAKSITIPVSSAFFPTLILPGRIVPDAGNAHEHINVSHYFRQNDLRDTGCIQLKLKFPGYFARKGFVPDENFHRLAL
jgi:hypothetical protein